MKFEYLFLFSQQKKGWHPMSVNGKELPAEEQTKTLYTFTNERGAEGWELVDTWRAGVSAWLIFKRLPLKV